MATAKLEEKNGKSPHFVSCKIDPDVLPPAKAAAALAGQDVQDWLSDLANRESAKQLGRKPIKRRAQPRQRGAS